MTDWFDTERLWELAFDFLFPAERIEGTEREVESILSLVGNSVRDALDMPCGPGRGSITLRRRGVCVTGVDSSVFMLGKAEAAAARAGVDVEWIREDMRRFVRPASYDLVLCLFTSIGYFEAHADNLKVLENARRSLRPGGAMVIETMNKERLARVFAQAGVMTLPDGRVLFEHRRVLDGWERIENDWYFLEGGRYERFTLKHFIYSAVELRGMLLAAGFSSVESYGGFDGSPFTGDTRLYVVARV